MAVGTRDRCIRAFHRAFGHIRGGRDTSALPVDRPVVAAQCALHPAGYCRNGGQHRLRGDGVLVDVEPATGARAGPVDAGLAFLGPSGGAALGGPVSGRLAARNKPFAVMGIGCTVAAVSLAVLAASHNFVVYLAALTACGFTMGFVYAFTAVATQAVVAPERAGEAAGVTLTSLVTLAGVGVAVSSSVLEVLEHQGLSTGDGIRAILAVIAALLLPAGLAVLAITRSKNRSPAIEGASS